MSKFIRRLRQIVGCRDTVVWVASEERDDAKIEREFAQRRDDMRSDLDLANLEMDGCCKGPSYWSKG